MSQYIHSRNSTSNYRDTTKVSADASGPVGRESRASQRCKNGRESDDDDIQDPPQIPLYSPTEIEDAWKCVLKMVMDYNSKICNAWRKEIDRQLSFATVFSAIVIAFTAYMFYVDVSLGSNTGDDTAQCLLFLPIEHVPNKNITVAETGSQLDKPLKLAPLAMQALTYWIISLGLLVCVPILGFICRLWLKGYEGETLDVSPQNAVALRYMRFELLRSSWFPEFLWILPLLLQGAVMLFSAGLARLLWACDHGVAAATAVLGCSIVCLFLSPKRVPRHYM